MADPDDRLDSWKDIAAHLKRDVSTVQRWEKREGMPVHRHFHDKLGLGLRVSGGARRVVEEPEPRPRRRRRAPRRRRESEPPRPVPSGRRRVAGWPSPPGSWPGSAPPCGSLDRSDADRRNPLADARFTHLTDFDGTEHAAAISRDGSFVAFLRTGTVPPTSG